MSLRKNCDQGCTALLILNSFTFANLSSMSIYEKVERFKRGFNRYQVSDYLRVIRQAFSDHYPAGCPEIQ